MMWNSLPRTVEITVMTVLIEFPTISKKPIACKNLSSVINARPIVPVKESIDSINPEAAFRPGRSAPIIEPISLPNISNTANIPPNVSLKLRTAFSLAFNELVKNLNVFIKLEITLAHLIPPASSSFVSPVIPSFLRDFLSFFIIPSSV